MFFATPILHSYIKRSSIWSRFTAEKMKFSSTDFLSKCDQIRSFHQLWLHLLNISLMENFFFLQWRFFLGLLTKVRTQSQRNISVHQTALFTTSLKTWSKEEHIFKWKSKVMQTSSTLFLAVVQISYLF